MTVWEALGRALSGVEDRPHLAAGLESARYTTRSGTAYVVLHNPAAASYARLDPREFELLGLMDGRHSVKELVIAYYQRFGVLALQRVAGLVGLLRRRHFLREPARDAFVQLGHALRPRGSMRIGVWPLPSRWVMDDVDGAFRAMYQAWGRYFFGMPWLVLGLLAGGLGPSLFIFELLRGRYALYAADRSALTTFAVLVVLSLLALALHELGHGLAVKHAGRNVNAAGARLYFGLPAAYVDTTDVWMAPPRMRLLTAFAGPWTGLMVGCACAVLAVALPSGEWGALSFTAAFVFLVDNLFNFNPLLELDGYYMLVDVLDMPLLRPRALAFVRGPLWARLAQRQPLSRQEWLLAAFGAGTLAYSAAVVVLAVRGWQGVLMPAIAGAWAGPAWQRAGAVLIACIVVLPLLGGAWSLTRELAQRMRRAFVWLSGRASIRRHREAIAALRAVHIWSELPEMRLLELAGAMRARDVAAGTEVVRQGQPGDCFYVVGEGAFEVSVDGEPRVRLERGDYFGERALLSGATRAANVVAVEPGRVYALERDSFEALLATDLALRARLEAALAYRAQVAEMPLFRAMGPAELDVLLARMLALDVPAGEVVIRQGDPGERFYLVESGAVEVSRDGEALARLGPGEAFGEIALLFDVPRTATVSALEPTRLLALEAADFRDLLAAYLGRAEELQRLSNLRLRTHRRLDEIV